MVTLGHKLGADDNVDLTRPHLADKLRRLGGRPECIRGNDGPPRIREKHRHLICDPLHARPAGNQRILLMTFGAGARRRQAVPAMMTLKPLEQPVFNHPRRAIGALEPVPAMAAKRQWRKAAAVEEKQRLLALRQHLIHRPHQCRCEPAAALGWILRQVDGRNFRHLCRAVPLGQLQFGIAALRDLLTGLDGGRGAGQHDRAALKMPAHHRDVTGMILDTFFLLEARLMRFIDDDQAKVAIGQEQRRSRADRHQRLALRNRAPCSPPLGLAQIRVPGDRRMAEARFETAEERLGQRDFREENQCLPPHSQSFGNGFEINLGLPGACDAVEQHRCKSPRLHRIDQPVRRRRLFVRQRWRSEIGIGCKERRFERSFYRLNGPQLHESANDPIRHIGNRRQFADQALPFPDPLKRLRALDSQLVRGLAGQPIFSDGRRALKCCGRRQRHAQHRRRGAEIIVRRPFNQPPERNADGRNIINLHNVAQAIVTHLRIGRHMLGFPHHSDHLARAEWGQHDTPRLNGHAVRHPVIERAESRIEKENAGASHGRRFLAPPIIAAKARMTL